MSQRQPPKLRAGMVLSRTLRIRLAMAMQNRTVPNQQPMPLCSLPLLRISLLLALPLLLNGCFGGNLRPLPGLNQRLAQLGASHNPQLSGRWLALIAGRQGRQQVQLLDLERGLPVPLPGLNRADSQPISVAMDQQGERLVLVRQRDDRTELVLHRRSLMASEAIPIEPAGVPRQVSLSADGRLLALEVSRGGLWQLDLLELP